MRVRDLLGMTVALGLVTAANLTAGVLLLLGFHAGGDHLNGVRGWALIGVGVVIAAVGAWLILSVAGRSKRREDALRGTARAGSPVPTSAWGMADVGDPHSGVVTVGDDPHGGGSPRLVGFSVSRLDVPLLIVGLLLWTAIFIFFFSPHCAAGAPSC